ncbi:MAG: SH3 domain-containing protein [Chloroflexi bacterium]|nr:SH3 domain-containing protein [Ardenticatenaceae bacterium]MBL1128159.1 hypothetical protein [Chloroflexota bacterium]NOG34232.1 SH3 domain-containing protein [Chloroflexota bacterium]GIK56346.1 MAG: hypothetical protein BroJett015_20090 [Chloroflexota bacterium]
MSRTTAFLLIGFAATLLFGVLSVSALLLGRSYFAVQEPDVTLITPIPFGQNPATATPTVTIEAPSVTPAADPVDSVATAEPTTAVAVPAATNVPPTAVTVLNTQVQYVMALADVNMRSGPGAGYTVIGWVAEGQIASVTGVSSDFGWWRVKCADGSTGSCWITAHNQYTQPSAAPVTACTNSAALVSDVSVPDGTQFAPNTGFNKIWRIKNTGTCTWDTSYKMVHAGGHLLGAVSTFFPLRDSVQPGHTVDLTINMVSPDAPNTYQSDWKLQDAQGQFFGVGRNNSPFWVKIVVSAAQPTTISGLIYQDWNQNGVYDNGETLMGSREVWLTPGTACHVRQDALAIVYSGADGRYTFSGMYNGSYCIGLVGNGGLLDDVASVAITTGQTLNGINLKSPAPSGSITGFVWDDYCLTNENGDALDGDCVADGNGDYHADGMIAPHEGYIAGVTMLLQAGACATGNPVAVTAVTDASGKYTFGSLQPGTYCVSMNAVAGNNAAILLPGDWTFPARGIWYQEITLLGNDHAYPVNFGWDYQLR